MLKVGNKKVIRTLSLRMMKANKKKNIAVIIAILLTTTMFTTLFSVGMSMLETTRKSTMRQVGIQSMAGFKYGRACDYEKLKADTKIKNISYRIIVGNLVEKSLEDLATEVYYATDENAKDMFSYPTTGRMPTAENEIAVSSITLDKIGLKKELGETIHLNIQIGEKVIENDFILSGYWEGDPVAMSQLAYVSKAYQEIAAPEPSISYYDSSWSNVTGYWSIDFNFYNSINIEKQVKELLKRNGYDPDIYQYGVNWAYETTSMDITTVTLDLVVLFIILMAGYLIIYNIFYIGVITDIHEYGLLKTIGTSRKQLKRIVQIQALSLAIIGIPIGLIIGTIVSRVIFPIILRNSSLALEDMVISIHPIIYIFAILFTLITVIIGCRKPGKIASRVSPIEAVKYEQITSSRKRKKKSKKITTVGLALANLARDKKRVGIVVLSLTLSVLLVNGIYSVIIGLDPDKYVSRNIIGDFNILNVAENSNLDNDSVLSKRDINYLSSLEGVTDCFNVYCDRSAGIEFNPDREKIVEQLLSNCKETAIQNVVESYKSSNWIGYDYYGIDEGVIDDLTMYEGKVDKEKWETGNYAVCYSYQIIDRSAEDKSIPMIHAGDDVTVTLQNGKQKTYTVMAIAKMPYAFSTKMYSTLGGQIIVPASEYVTEEGDTGALVRVLNVEADALDSVGAKIDTYVNQADYLTYVSKQLYLDEFDEFIRSIEIIGGALAFILAIIGVMNFANAIITGIWRRSREMAIMQAVGLTKKQLIGMLVYEGMFYGFFAVLVTILIHITIGGAFIKFLAGEIWFFEYHFTIMPIVICLPFILFISALIPFLTYHKMKNQSIVERMKIV
jgi:putative ABC transport system permease protein